MSAHNRIIVKTSELLKTIIEVANDEKEAVEISIGYYENYDTGEMEKCIAFGTLECGGRGACFDFDRVPEMSPLEIELIP